MYDTIYVGGKQSGDADGLLILKYSTYLCKVSRDIVQGYCGSTVRKHFEHAEGDVAFCHRDRGRKRCLHSLV